MITDIEFHNQKLIPDNGFIPQKLFTKIDLMFDTERVDRLRYMFDTEILSRFYNHLLCCALTDYDIDRSFETTKESPIYESDKNVFLSNVSLKDDLDCCSVFNKIQRLSIMDVSNSYEDYFEKRERIGEITPEQSIQLLDLYGLASVGLIKGFCRSLDWEDGEVQFYKDNHGFFCKNIFVDVIASRNIPKRKDTLKLLYHYLLAEKLEVEWVDKIEYIGIYNVNHKRLFYMPVESIPEDSMREVEKML